MKKNSIEHAQHVRANVLEPLEAICQTIPRKYDSARRWELMMDVHQWVDDVEAMHELPLSPAEKADVLAMGEEINARTQANYMDIMQEYDDICNEASLTEYLDQRESDY